MKLLEKLIRHVPEDTVEEVILGVHSVLVKSVNNAGIASTIKYCSPSDAVRKAGMLETLNLKQLATYALSDNLLEASIGMAAINCSVNIDNGEGMVLNAKDIILEKGKNKTLGIIGHFPFLEKQRDNYKKCYIFEKSPHEGDLAEADIPTYLPTVDVAAITATAITNHTFENILKSLPEKSFNVILGPSTPLSTLLYKYGMNVLSGSIVTEYDLLKRHVLQAAPTRNLPGLKMVSMIKEEK